jgi:hypothetical protein
MPGAIPSLPQYAFVAWCCVEILMKSRRMRWMDHALHNEEIRNAYEILVGKPERKRPTGKTWHSWEGNIKKYLQGVGCEDVNSVHMA